MSLETDIRVRLSGSTALTAIVSSGKIFQNYVPQGIALPAISYFRVSEQTPHAMGADPKLRGARFQVSGWSTSSVQAKSIASAVINRLRDFSGALSTAAGGITVQRIFFDGQQSIYDFDSNSKKTIFHFPMDFIIWSTED